MKDIHLDTQPFQGYTHRAKFVIESRTGEQLLNVDIYCNYSDRKYLESYLMNKVKTMFKRIDEKRSGIIHWATREQDERTAAMLTEILNTKTTNHE